jgi:serine/threonine protein kinase
MSKLISQGGFGCVYYPGITCEGHSEKDKKVVSKLQKTNFNSRNEVAVGKYIAEIPNYNIYFIPVESECKIDLRSIKGIKTINDCDIIKSATTEYVLMKMKYIKSDTFYKSLISNSHGKVGRKKTILSIIETFTYLLEATEKLLLSEIVHFDLKGGNILYNLKTGFPLMIDFGISIPMKKLNNKNMKEYFYGFIPEYYIWCLDIHIINYLIYETREPLTISDAEQISTLFVKTNKGLDVFSPQFRKQYHELCLRQLKTLTGIPREKVIKMMLENYKTWDLYSLGIIFLRLFKYMFPNNFHRNQIIILFSQILLFNIHPDPAKRYDIAKTKETFNNIFYMIGEVKEYTELIEEMDYDETVETRKINEDIMQLQHILTKSMKNKAHHRVG